VGHRRNVGAGHLTMRRRDLLILAAGIPNAWPLIACAEQKVTPVIGILSSTNVSWSAFPDGLSQTGFVQGKNVAFAYQLGTGQYEELPAMAAALVHRKVNVIVAFGSVEARAAKSVTTTIPIVFESEDPIAEGLIDGLARPGGNLTGVSLVNAELMAKRVGLLSELVPKAKVLALLINPESAIAGVVVRNTQDAARASGIEIQILKASNLDEVDPALKSLPQLHAGALIVGPDKLFTWEGSTRVVVPVAARRIPAIYSRSDIAWSGGLISYGASEAAARRQMGIYTGRILKGENPADLPVQQPTKFDLVVNMKTAKTLGLTVPPSILARADEVIE
jgi:putative tryptophan/tyrosine transport system substrate-binding protein